MSYENVIWKQPRPGTSGNKTQLLDRRPKVRSEENPEMKSTITRSWLITIALAVALAMSGCGGGGGGGGSNRDMPMPGGLSGDWELITDPSLGPVGVEHEDYGLRVWYDSNLHPDIYSSAPYQPTIQGRWTGEWAGYVAESENVSVGPARIDVTLDSGVTNAELTYDGIPEFGSISSGMMSVTDGAFSGSRTVPDAGTYQIRGQFGGSDQASGVAGYVDGPGLQSVFYGDR